MRSFAYGFRTRTGLLACALLCGACGDSGGSTQGAHDHDASMSADAAMGGGDAAMGDAGVDAGGEDSLCPDLPPFQTGMEQLGQFKKIRAKLVSAAPNPPLRYSNDWVVDFVTPKGDPITDLEVQDAHTFMPSHGHNGTYEPTVTADSEPGRYKFKGFYFTMRGPWEVIFALGSKSAGDDLVTFNVCVGE
jgi:hypothetical protein